jgi:hypothetical protein
MRSCHEGSEEGAVRSGRHSVSVLNAGIDRPWFADHTIRRPGILVLINDADWELEGEDKYEIEEGDNILFVSTLHGG